MESEQGIGLAALRSPAEQASTSIRSEGSAFRRALSPWSLAALENTHRVPPPELEPLEENEGAVREIGELFRRRLAGLRRMPRYQRAHALRAAREWRRQALKALKEKRTVERHARHLIRQQQKLTPG